MTFYDAIVARFNASAALCGTLASPGPFTGLWQAAPPTPSTKPYAVLDTGTEPHVSYCFSREFHQETFTITVVTADQEDGQAKSDVIIALFKDCESQLSIEDVNVTNLLKIDRSYAKIEDGFWTTTINYRADYDTPR